MDSYSVAENGEPDPARDGSSDSLKELVLKAGLELLDREGLSLTFDSISYAKVFDYLSNEYEVSVTRGSVHERIWASQDDFRRDVLAESVAYFPMDSVSEAILNRAASSESAEGFAKDLGSRFFPKVIESHLSGRFQSVKALASWFDDPLATETLHRLLNEWAEKRLDDARVEFPATIARLGLRPKASLGLSDEQAAELCCVLIAALTEGGRLNYHAGSHDVTATIGFRPNKSQAEESWRVLSVGVACLLDFLYEGAPTTSEGFPSAPLSRPQMVPKVEPNSHLPSEDVDSEPRSSRRPRAQLRELVLTAAVELLLHDGPQLRPEVLSYTSVFAHLKESRGVTVHRSSVHPRIWKSNDDFRHEVLTRSLEDSAYPVRAVSDVVVALPPILNSDRSIDRTGTAHELFRNAGAALPGVESDELAYRRLLQIKAALIDQQDSVATKGLRTAVANAERLRMDGNKAELQTLVLDLGFRVRPGTGLSEHDALELFEVLTMTTAAGTMFNQLAGISAATKRTTVGPRGDRWTPLAIAMAAYFDQLYEEVPE